MKFVALTRMQDDGAAQLAQDAIAEMGIPVRVLRRGVDPYFGSALSGTYDLWVPEEHLAEAREALSWLERDAAVSLLEAGFALPVPLPPARTEVPPRRRLSFALVLALLVPFPVACWYARAIRLAHGLLWMCGAALILGLLTQSAGRALDLILAVKLVDAVLAPVLVAVSNRSVLSQAASSRELSLAVLLSLSILGMALTIALDHGQKAQRPRTQADRAGQSGNRLLYEFLNADNPRIKPGQRDVSAVGWDCVPQPLCFSPSRR